MPDVVVDMRRLERYRDAIDNGLRSTAPGPMRVALKQMAAVYRAFLRRRFSAYSRGGGDWSPLKPATVKRKRKKSKGKKRIRSTITSGTGGVGVAILVDKGLLMGALQPHFIDAPGAIEEQIPFGIRVGYGGPAAYPGSRATVAEIASYHQIGGGRLPKREIIVPPDVPVANRMARLLLNKMKDIASGRA